MISYETVITMNTGICVILKSDTPEDYGISPGDSYTVSMIIQNKTVEDSYIVSEVEVRKVETEEKGDKNEI